MLDRFVDPPHMSDTERAGDATEHLPTTLPGEHCASRVVHRDAALVGSATSREISAGDVADPGASLELQSRLRGGAADAQDNVQKDGDEEEDYVSPLRHLWNLLSGETQAVQSPREQ
jgi:hypothetical protein